jgi:hypothetical protein
MRVVAGKTLPLGNRGMIYFISKFLLVMTSEAELSAFCEKELHRLGIFFMGFRVAGDASACLDYGMDHLSGHLYFMAF